MAVGEEQVAGMQAYALCKLASTHTRMQASTHLEVLQRDADGRVAVGEAAGPVTCDLRVLTLA